MPRQAEQRDPDLARGARLRDARQRAGKEQQEVAALLGVQPGTVRRWERGHWLSAGTLARLAHLYGVSEQALRGATAGPAVISASSHGSAPAWPQWAREMWAELQLELVRAGVSDAHVASLRGFVLPFAGPNVTHSSHEQRLEVDAGIEAARAWVRIRYGQDVG